MLIDTITSITNSFLITRTTLPPFITTLSIINITHKLTFIISNTITIYKLPKSFHNIGKNKIGPIPLPLIYLIMITVTNHIMLSHTQLKRYTYTISSNKNATQLSNIPINQILTNIYIISNTLTNLNNIITTSHVHSNQPNYNINLKLNIITTYIIDKSSLFNNQKTINNTLINAFLINIIHDNTILLNITQYYQQIVINMII